MTKDNDEKLIKCEVCGKEFKRITAGHLKTHGMTLMEYNKLYNRDKYYIDRCIQFLEDYYITVKYRYVEAIKGHEPMTITNDPNKKGYIGLTSTHLKHHIMGRKNIAIYFPKSSSKLIGFDVDTKDFSVVEKVYNAILNKGIPKDCIAISSSGNKGFHVDVFLEQLLGFYYTKRFYKAILEDTGLSEDIVEVRGAGGQAYKLPITKHRNTYKECCFLDLQGNKIDTLEAIESYKKADIELIKKVVLDCNRVKKQPTPVQPTASDEALMLEFEEMDATVNQNEKYSITNGAKIRYCEELLEKGYHEDSHRNPTILLMATYFKDVKEYCLKDTLEAIQTWVDTKWSKKLIDKEFLKKKDDTIKRVYREKMTFWTSANEIVISLPEIREIFSVTTNNKLQTQALRKLYYILLLHHKAYANKNNEWTFYMTYEQMMNSGAIKNNRQQAMKQLRELEKLGKVNIVSCNKFRDSTMKAPNEYQLPQFVSYVVETETVGFKICDLEIKCKDCMYKALCHLVSDKERRKHIKGKEFTQLVLCPYNT